MYTGPARTLTGEVAMPQHTLTKRDIETAPPGRHSDGGGLYLQVTPSGTRSWLLRYKRQGRSHWMGLGSAVTLTLAEARERARLERVRLLDGIDPLAHRRADRRRAEVTFKTCAEAVIEARRATWSAESYRQWTVTLAEHAYPVFGDLPVSHVDTALVLRAVEPLWKRRQVTADRLRQRIEAVLDWASARGHRSGDNPARWRGHLQHVLTDTAKVEHHAALPYAELPGFMAALRARPGVAARALEFTILTAVRSGETLGAKWSEIEGDTWTIPAERMKANRPHTVPLAPAARRLLDGLEKAGGFVFGSPRHPSRQMEKHAMADALKAMG
ncbi:MAG TPA: integrase arm-type DNA-binding domain-containing protein, partial [Xanthobacteraceae bacterium]